MIRHEIDKYEAISRNTAGYYIWSSIGTTQFVGLVVGNWEVDPWWFLRSHHKPKPERIRSAVGPAFAVIPAYQFRKGSQFHSELPILHTPFVVLYAGFFPIAGFPTDRRMNTACRCGNEFLGLKRDLFSAHYFCQSSGFCDKRVIVVPGSSKSITWPLVYWVYNGNY